MKLLLYVAIVFISLNSNAGVNAKNGNYFISYIDVIFNKAEITRTYNSRSTEIGFFGFGWGSGLEARLERVPGGFILKHNGSGGATEFPVPELEKEPESVIPHILSALSIDSDSNKGTKLRKKLIEDYESLVSHWLKASKNEPNIAKTLKSIPTDISIDETGATHEVYTLLSNNNSFEVREQGKFLYKFDKTGRLVGFRQDDVHIEIDWTNYPENLVLFSGNDKVSIKFNRENESPLIELIKAGGKQAGYEYDLEDPDKPLLVYSSDMGGKKYYYQYDDDYHLTQIGYEDGASLVVSYEPMTLFTKVFQDRENIKMYEYVSKKTNPNLNYGTEYYEYDDHGLLKGKRFVEYEIKIKDFGVTYIYRTKTLHRGIEQEIWFNECCELPVRFITDGQEITVAYGNTKKIERQIKQIASKERVLNFSYNQIGKITAVEWVGVGIIQYELDEKTKKMEIASETDPGLAKVVAAALQVDLARYEDASECKCRAWR